MEIFEDKIFMRQPDDGHNHTRWYPIVSLVAPTLNIYGRVVCQGNLTPPVESGAQVDKFRTVITQAAATDQKPGAKIFTPVMVVMLTRNTTPASLRDAFAHGAVILKFMESGISTNSANGISFYELPQFYPVYQEAEKLGMVASFHPEIGREKNGDEIRPLDREVRSLPFIAELIKKFPKLKVILEHLSTAEGIRFVERHPSPNVAASLTEKHALMLYSDVCNRQGRIIKPWNYCKPIFKLKHDRYAVRRAMTSGHPKFFWGSDSAPWPAERKQGNDPAAGIYSHASETIAILAQIFKWEYSLSNQEKFTSENWAKFMGYPLNQGYITISRRIHTIPKMFGNLPVFMGGENVEFTVEAA